MSVPSPGTGRGGVSEFGVWAPVVDTLFGEFDSSEDGVWVTYRTASSRYRDIREGGVTTESRVSMASDSLTPSYKLSKARRPTIPSVVPEAWTCQPPTEQPRDDGSTWQVWR
jgi:hypothetical protein